MAIVGLLRRYKRWNPVHPTYGAFWGVGLGLGCGVGWGPGFGPDVVGYVGSGCGLGLGMGITLVGVGVGLPATGLVCVPCNVVTGAGQRVSQMTTVIVPVLSSFATRTWQSVGTHISLLDRQLRLKSQISGDLSSSKQNVPSSLEAMQQTTRDDVHDFNRRSQVRFSTSSYATHSSQQDIP